MKHPLEFIPRSSRKPIFFTLLFLTLILFAVFRVLDQPLQTPAAPNGIVSFELAHTSRQAQAMIDVWTGRMTIYSSPDGQNFNATPTPPSDAISFNSLPIIYAAFELGLDYLFMPVYALTFALAILLVAGRHPGFFAKLGAFLGWGMFLAAFLDAIENYALLHLLLTKVYSPFPEIAYYCASDKFLLLGLALVYSLIGFLIPLPAAFLPSSTAVKD